MKFLKAKRFSAALIATTLITLILGGCSYFTASKDKRYLLPEEKPAMQTPVVKESAQQEPELTAKQDSGQSGFQMPGCTCHSKRPGIVRMHDALDGENCDQCHKGNENLMDPNRPASAKADLEKRIKSEPVCTKCHLDNGKIIYNGIKKSKVKISGGFFCPKCKKQVNIKDKVCTDCNGTIVKSKTGWECSSCGPLVDVDEIAALSKKKPSNDICVICHYNGKELTLKHSQIEAYNKSAAGIKDGLNNCLACHKSHNQCGGCHF